MGNVLSQYHVTFHCIIVVYDRHIVLKMIVNSLRHDIFANSHTDTAALQSILRLLLPVIIPPVVIIPLLVSSIIICVIHAITKSINIIHSIVPSSLNILRNVFHFLHLASSPLRRILREVLDIVDRIVPAILNSIAKAFNTTDLLAGPTGSILWEIGDVVAPLIDALLRAILVLFIILFCGSSNQHQVFRTGLSGG